MKTWLAKWKISNALDEGRTLPTGLQRTVARSEKLQRFANNSAGLDRALKNSPPHFQTSASLHAAIMRAVRDAEFGSAPAFHRQKVLRQWIPKTVLAALILLVIFAAENKLRLSQPVAKPAALSTFAEAGFAVETGSKLFRALPDAALRPLNDERLRLNRDLANAKNFLLASLP